MAAVTQTWVGYLDRSYQQMKQSILNRIPTNNPELTDFSEGNPLVMLVSIFCGIGEMLGIYIDATARETFIGTVRKYASILKLVKLIDYRTKSMVAPTVDLLFTLVDSTSGLPTPYLPGNIDFPIYTQVNSQSRGIPFYSQVASSMIAGQTGLSIPFSSYTTSTGNNLGTSDGTSNQKFVLPTNYAYKTSVLTIGSDTWNEYDSLGLMGANTKGYIVDVLSDGNAYVIFGDGVNGAIPTVSAVVFAQYGTTVGPLGNLPPNSIQQLISSIIVPTGYKLIITNPDYSNNGSDIEGLEDIRSLAPRSLRTLNRAVTWQDYIDIACMAPGVGQAIVSYCTCCAAQIDLYVAPKTRGIASSLLLSIVLDYFNGNFGYGQDKKILGRRILVHPAGITRLYVDIGVTAAPGSTATITALAVINSLNSTNGYLESEINELIEPASIIAQIKALPSVIGVSINQLYLEPYARPVGTNTAPLVSTWGAVHSATRISYKVHYDGTNMLLYKNSVFFATLTIGTPYNDGTIFTITIGSSGLYVDGMEWTFIIYPTYPEVFLNYALQVDDYSMPIVDVDYTTVISGLPVIFSNITVIPSTGPGGICPTC